MEAPELLKQSLPHDAHTDGDISLMLELPENDQFFKKKKSCLQKLLEDMGSHAEHVYIRSSASPGELKSSLHLMLQRARIINLDEMELYFGGPDVTDLVGFNSPRNEMEALNSILTAIAKLSGEQFAAAVQELRVATVDLISELAVKFKEEREVVSKSSCEPEKCLQQWGEDRGVKSQLEISCKAKAMVEFHAKAKSNLEEAYSKLATRTNKGRRKLELKRGDWVWVHLHKERFPTQQKGKLAPRGGGPFQVLQKINNNANVIDLPGEYNVSNTFNVSNLTPCVSGESGGESDDAISRTKSSQDGEDDTGTSQHSSSRPFTRSQAKELHDIHLVWRRELAEGESLETRLGWERVVSVLTCMDRMPLRTRAPPNDTFYGDSMT